MDTIFRDVFSELTAELGKPEVMVLLGPRQVGKTTLLRSLEKYVAGLGAKTLFFDLEQPSDLRTLSGDEADVIAMLINDADYVFIDEFYYLKNAGHIFKAVYDKCCFQDKKVKIIVSGSSSVEIHRHLQDGQSLAGRHMVFRVFPLSYSEFLSGHGDAALFDRFLTYGGMPGLALEDDSGRKQNLLQNYVTAYLLSDVRGMVETAQLQDFNKVLYAIADDQGALINSASLAEQLNIPEHTVEQSLSVMQQTHSIYELNSYRPRRVTELRHYRKCYLYDLGIRNSILKDFRLPSLRHDARRIYESFVVLSLVPRLAPNIELRFWQVSKGERVDFVLLIDREPIPIVLDLDLKAGAIHHGFTAFRRDCTELRRTLTITRHPFETIMQDGVSHEFVSLKDVSSILPMPASSIFEPPESPLKRSGVAI
ncbi:MAG: ATP-binding protein [Bdellovibrionales bacterium]|nr:ATP-binding protein [Bdellovibrionales bacterium]